MTPSAREQPLVLVAYATRFGSTRGIAERIAARLRDLGLRVELLRADQVNEMSGYDAVVFGSAVFNQRWLPEAEQLVRRNLEALGSRPTWLFSVGSFGDRKRFIGPLMRREPKDIRELDETCGRAITACSPESSTDAGGRFSPVSSTTALAGASAITGTGLRSTHGRT